MSKKDFHFPFQYKEWLVSTSDWDADIRGWYINLLCHQADKGMLPDDDESLAVLAGVKFSQYARFKNVLKATLKAKFQANAQGMLVNLKLDELLHERKEYLNTKSKSGVIGGLIKKGRVLYPNFEDWETVAEQLLACDLHDMSMEDKEDLLKAKVQANIKAKGKPSIDSDSIDNNKIKKVVELYHHFCPTLPRVKELSKTRHATIKARIKEHGIKNITEVLQAAGQSQFLTGQNKESWTATFDWLLKPSNLIKVLEGNYKNKTKSTGVTVN